jgi:hypothetical protein
MIFAANLAMRGEMGSARKSCQRSAAVIKKYIKMKLLSPRTIPTVPPGLRRLDEF